MKNIVHLKTDGVVEEHPTDVVMLADLQRMVGGYIQLVHCVWQGKPMHMFCNEEGKLKGLSVNPRATEAYWAFHGRVDVIMGDVVITDPDWDTE